MRFIKKILLEQEEKRKKLFVLVGPPSTGKTTWIASTFSEPPYIISRDDIVEEVAAENGWSYDDMFVTPGASAEIGEQDEKYGEVQPAPSYMPWTKTVFSKVLKANGKVHYLFTQKVAGAASSDKDVVVDMTNMNTSARKQALAAAGDADFKKIAVVFEFQGAEDIIKKVAAKRAAAAKRMGKSKTIPDNVMDKMFSAFSRPSKSEGFDEIISVDNREALKRIANESDSVKESKMDLKKKWKMMVEGRSFYTDWDEDEYYDDRNSDKADAEASDRQERLAGFVTEFQAWLDENPGTYFPGDEEELVRDVHGYDLDEKSEERAFEAAHEVLSQTQEVNENKINESRWKKLAGILKEEIGTNDSVDGPYLESSHEDEDDEQEHKTDKEEMKEQAAPLDFSGENKTDDDEEPETLDECGEDEMHIEWNET